MLCIIKKVPLGREVSSYCVVDWTSLYPCVTQVIPGMMVREGTRIEIPLYSAHHLEELHPDPDKFRPERFLKGDDSVDIQPYSFIPFGGGLLYLCVGGQLGPKLTLSPTYLA